MPCLLDGILASSPDECRIRAWLSDAGWSGAATASMQTRQDIALEEFAEAVAMCAWREWAVRPSGGPDPREAARGWAMAAFDDAPPVSETLITARESQRE
jgi:hypothetical protein